MALRDRKYSDSMASISSMGNIQDCYMAGDKMNLNDRTFWNGIKDIMIWMSIYFIGFLAIVFYIELYNTKSNWMYIPYLVILGAFAISAFKIVKWNSDRRAEKQLEKDVMELLDGAVITNKELNITVTGEGVTYPVLKGKKVIIKNGTDKNVEIHMKTIITRGKKNAK